MTLNKFEKDIRDKLQGREIKPSPQAWEKVSANLDTVSKPKGITFFRYGIAAGFIGILFLSVLYFRGSEIPAGEIELVGDPAGKTEGISETENRKALTEINQDETLTETGELPASEGQRSIHPSKLPVQPRKVAVVLKPDTSELTVKTDKAAERIIEVKLMEVVADIQKMEQGRQALSELEVDSLLRKAQDELLTSVTGGDTSINARALLMEVEDELDESFREKLFNKLQEGFQKVRTAVADRNN